MVTNLEIDMQMPSQSNKKQQKLEIFWKIREKYKSNTKLILLLLVIFVLEYFGIKLVQKLKEPYKYKYYKIKEYYEYKYFKVKKLYKYMYLKIKKPYRYGYPIIKKLDRNI